MSRTRQLIDAHQDVLDSVWTEAQPGADDETKGRYAFVYDRDSGASIAAGSSRPTIFFNTSPAREPEE